jgi:hypothetical protein
MLSKVRGVCSPETFNALQAIFDSAWAEIAASATVTSENIGVQRTRLAEVVMAQMNREDLAETAKVRAEIIKLFNQGQGGPTPHQSQ